LIAEEALMPEKNKAKAIAASVAGYAADVNSANVTIEIYKAQGERLTWGDDGVESVAVRIAELGEDEGQACPRQFPPGHGPVHIPVYIRPKTMARIETTYITKGSAAAVPCTAVTTSIDCGGTASIQVFASLQPDPPRFQPETATLLIQPYWSANKAGGRDRVRAAEIAWATAELVGKLVNTRLAPARNEVHVQATVYGGAAALTLLKGGTYKVDVGLKEKFSGSYPPLSDTIPVCWSGEQEYPVYFEPHERMVALLFVDSFGKPAYPNDVRLEGRGQTLAISSEGRYTLTGADVGRVRFSSTSYDLRPNEIDVDERMAQAYVVQVAPWVAERPLRELEPEEILLDLTEALKEDEQAVVKVLGAEGRLLDTLVAERDGTVRYNRLDDEAVMLQAVAHGKPYDQVALPRRR
jgi:hypothetical protein